MRLSNIAAGALVAVPLAVLSWLGPAPARDWSLEAAYAPQEMQERPPGSAYEGQAFRFTRIADDVYIAIGTGSLTVFSNAVIVINDADVLLVDSHVSPAAAWALLQELRTITDKPVRYVVNTHYHFDHAHGNQIYGPEVEIIGHEFARAALAEGRSLMGRSIRRYIQPIPAQISALRAQLDTASQPQTRAALERRLAVQENFKAATDAVRPTPPNVVVSERLTLYRGGREIRLIFFGRGHTGGDLVVYLPAERVLATGDLIYDALPWMGDAFIPDWIDTLEQLKSLDFDVMLPGHGQPVRDRTRIDKQQAYLRDLWAQVVELHNAGVPVAEAARRIDLRAHAANYASARNMGADLDAVERAYELLEGGG
jgi:glyoxylase-like metal-dependent hydrolase (beta-lactamase superfamily II)